MSGTLIINEITDELNTLNNQKLSEILNFVKFLKYQKEIDATTDILNDSVFYDKVKKGIEEKNIGEVVSWEDMK